MKKLKALMKAKQCELAQLIVEYTEQATTELESSIENLTEVIEDLKEQLISYECDLLDDLKAEKYY